MHRVKAGFWTLIALALTSIAVDWTAPALASSHREAPLITEMPKVDGTDFYMFRSYEPGRANYVTFLANYIPIQAPYGGPNFFELDADARYQINVENDGTDGDDLVFEFRFYEVFKDQKLSVGGVMISHPLRAVAPIPFSSDSNDVWLYTVDVIRDGVRSSVTNGRTNGIFFAKAFDNAGPKTIADYAGYANNLIYPINIPGCSGQGKVFVGQRKESFAVNLGEVFDLVNVPEPDRSARRQGQRARRQQHHHARGRGADPLPDRRQRRGRRPHHGMAAAHPPAPRQSQRLRADAREHGLRAGLASRHAAGQRGGHRSARQEQVQRQPARQRPGQLRRLRHQPDAARDPRAPVRRRRSAGSQQLPARRPGGGVRHRRSPGSTSSGSARCSGSTPRSHRRPRAAQSNLGLLGGDNAGFPNGRRPGDDVVDIELRVAMGVVCHAFPGVYCNPADAPSGLLPFTDQTLQDASQFDATFPYLRTPIPGAPNNE